LKLLFLVDDVEAASLGEASLWLSELAALWATRGHRVEIVCLRALETWQVPHEIPGVVIHRPGPDGFEAVLGEVLGQAPDAVHVATAGPLGPRVIEILRELPVLIDVHDFWPICPNNDLLRRPRLLPCGEHYPFQGCGACAGLSRLRAMEERTELLASARLVVAHSAFNRVRLNAGLGRAIELLDYGADTSRFRPDPDPPLSPEVGVLYASRERPRVLFLGPPTHARGADLLIDLMTAVKARLAGVELVVAGRDPSNPEWDQVFRAEARELGLEEHVQLVPTVPVRDLPALYASCHIAIAPVVASEPGGLFVLQALAAGLPVVASPAGAIQELLRQGEEGLMIPSRDTASFANAITTLLVDPHARTALGETARLTAVEHHDFERTVFALEELYHRLRESKFGAAA
jgi:glycosyltransferase involved in cell wall biosynthesis